LGKKSNLIKALEKFSQEIASEYPLSNMYLFGSRVRGKVKTDSDVDLLLVSKKFMGKRRIKRSPPLYLKWNLKYPVDFVCLTPEEFKKKKKEFGVVQEAIKEGVRII